MMPRSPLPGGPLSLRSIGFSPGGPWILRLGLAALSLAVAATIQTLPDRF